MRAPVSVIVPTLNSATELPAMAASLIEGLDAGVIAELIVTDGGSSDGTQDIAAGLGARWVLGQAGRGAQLSRGVKSARGAWFLMLHSDTQLHPGWAEAVSAHLRAGPARAAVFRLAFRAPGLGARQTEWWANFRTRAFGLPYGDQGMLVHRGLLASVGGIPDYPLMEDVALARALRGKIDVLPATASTSADKYVTRGWYRQGAANILRLTRFLSGTDPHTLAREYRA